MKMPEKTSLERIVPSGTRRNKAYAPSRTAFWIWIALGIFIVQAAGCIRIPEENWMISHRGQLDTRMQTEDCNATCLDRSTADQVNPERMDADQAIRPPELNTGGFRLVSWNIFKGKRNGWAEDFQKLSRNTDILILQEAYLTVILKKLLQQEAYHWDMTTAFEYRQIEAGVLTASRTAPNFTCMFRETEPITRIPKSVLITRYPLVGTDRELVVANIHAVNFTSANSGFQKQNDRLEKILAAHRGPMIVSGDFNTWNTGRMSRVNAMAKRLDLTAVKFDENRRARFFGQDIDHIYYRGLEANNAETFIVSTSDHNPLAVVFKLADESDPVH